MGKKSKHALILCKQSRAEHRQQQKTTELTSKWQLETKFEPKWFFLFQEKKLSCKKTLTNMLTRKKWQKSFEQEDTIQSFLFLVLESNPDLQDGRMLLDPVLRIREFRRIQPIRHQRINLLPLQLKLGYLVFGKVLFRSTDLDRRAIFSYLWILLYTPFSCTSK